MMTHADDTDQSLHSSFVMTVGDVKEAVNRLIPLELKRCPAVHIIEDAKRSLTLNKKTSMVIQTNYQYTPEQLIHTITLHKFGQFVKLEYNTERGRHI